MKKSIKCKNSRIENQSNDNSDGDAARKLVIGLFNENKFLHRQCSNFARIVRRLSSENDKLRECLLTICNEEDIPRASVARQRQSLLNTRHDIVSDLLKPYCQ